MNQRLQPIIMIMSVLALAGISSVITLIVILSKIFGTLEVNDEGEREWGREAEEYGVIVVAAIFMMTALVFLVAMWFRIPLDTNTKPFRIGLLVGSTAMYANIFLLSRLYFYNFESDEEDDEQGNRRFLANNNNNYYNDNNNGNGEEMEEGRMQQIMSTASLIFFFVYVLASVLIFMIGQKFIARNEHDSSGTHDALSGEAKTIEIASNAATAHADVLTDLWKSLTIFSIASTIFSIIIGFISLFGEEGERMREEGKVYNFLYTALYTLVLLSILFAMGKRTFSRKVSISEKEVGGFVGVLYFFGVGCLFLACLYGGIAVTLFNGEGAGRGMEEQSAGSLVFAFFCFTFAMAYFTFASMLSKYQLSILHVNNETVASDYVAMQEGNNTSMINQNTRKETEMVNKNDDELHIT